MNVVLDFDVELADSYTGTRLEILRDHEYGHVTIGQQKAEEHLKDNLEQSLEGFSALTPAAIQTTINNAATNFEVDEGAESQAYDDLDYPRMQQAYYGARTPLEEMANDAPNIATMVETIENMAGALPLTTDDRYGELAQPFFDARNALSDDELACLQYNPEFKELVAHCETIIRQFLADDFWNLFDIDSSDMDSTAQDTLENVLAMLGDFEWVAPV